LKTYASSSPPQLPLPLWPPKREYNAVSAERSMEFGNAVRVETSRYLTKITTPRRKAGEIYFFFNSAQFRSRMISPSCHQLYIVTVANACGRTQGQFWLPWRIILVALENCSGSPGELSWLARGVELKQFRTYLTYASSFFPLCLCLSLQRGQ